MNPRTVRAPLRSALLAGVLAAASVTIGGCLTDGPPPSPVATQSPLDQYPIPVAEAPEQLQLAVHPGGLSFHQREVLRGFAGRWREAEADTLTVQVPTGGPDAPLARDAALQAMDALMALGVPAGRLRLVGYDAGGRPGAPILASFLKYQAQIPDCSGQWDNLTSTKDNRPYKAFGCSVSSNAAVQVANARDLVRPAASTDADASRRQVVMGKYRDGKTTSSEKDAQATGAVSTVVGSN